MRALAVLAAALAVALVARAVGRRPAAEPLPSDVQRDPWPDEVLSNVAGWEPDPPYLEALPLARMRAAYGGRTIGGM